MTGTGGALDRLEGGGNPPVSFSPDEATETADLFLINVGRAVPFFLAARAIERCRASYQVRPSSRVSLFVFITHAIVVMATTTIPTSFSFSALR